MKTINSPRSPRSDGDITTINVRKSPRSDKKWTAEVKGKKVNFGQKGYEDFTMHKNENRKKNYISRHSGNNENWRDWFTPGFWSRWLLWNKPTLQKSIESIESQFPLHINLQQNDDGEMMVESHRSSQMMISDNDRQYSMTRKSRRRKKGKEAEEDEEEEKVEVKNKKGSLIMSKSRGRKNGKETYNKRQGEIRDEKDKEMLKRMDDILSQNGNILFPRL